MENKLETMNLEELKKVYNDVDEQGRKNDKVFRELETLSEEDRQFVITVYGDSYNRLADCQMALAATKAKISLLLAMKFGYFIM